MTPSPHPAWLAVGSTVWVVRSLGHSVAWRKTQTVARHTKTLVVLDNGDRYRKVTAGLYELNPAYLDYFTRLLPPTAGSAQ